MKKIYTRTGDWKDTGILGGIRLSKHSARIEALGSLDELNSFLGFLLALSDNLLKSQRERRMKAPFRRRIEQIQRNLFVIGTDLSQPLIRTHSIPHPLRRHYLHATIHSIRNLPEVTHSDIHDLEEWIDHIQAHLPPLRNFILPQGNPLGAFSQVVRAICRRTERRVVQLAMRAKVNPLILAYLNRLSDFLFLLARALNYSGSKTEIIWKYDP